MRGEAGGVLRVRRAAYWRAKKRQKSSRQRIFFAFHSPFSPIRSPLSKFFLFKTGETVYNKAMDDRKRQISEAENKKKEQTALLDALLAQIGEAIFERTADSGADDVPAFVELAAYRRFQDDIAGFRDSIQSAEEQMRRFRELEEGIGAKEREETACSRDLSGFYGRLGKLLLEEAGRNGEDSSAYEDFCAPHRSQADELLAKVSSLEDRLAGLEQKEKGNVFTWIGKSAQSLVLRSFLGKAQESLEQLRRTAGERFCRRRDGEFPENAAIDSLCGEIEQKRLELEAISEDLASLKGEKRKISEGFSAEGGPAKHIQAMKSHIAQAQGELKALYRSVGAEAALGGAFEANEPERRQTIQSFVRAEDKDSLESAGRMSQTIQDCETVVEKLRASLAIDDEKAKIEKCRRMIQEKRSKIAQAEKSILEIEDSIRDSEASIEKLREIL